MRDKQLKRNTKQQSKRPFAKSDLEAVLKSATKPLKKESSEKESEETPLEPIFMDAERQKLELDITQEFEFADGEATSLIDETK